MVEFSIPKNSIRRNPVIEIELANQQTEYSFDESRLLAAARRVLEEEGIRQGTVSIAAVDADHIHELNREYLQHDYPTDVLSFLFEQVGDRLEGEVVVCPATAAQIVAGTECTLEDELLLYVVHGTLHLVGYDDGAEDDRSAMRARERYFLDQLGAHVVHETESSVDLQEDVLPPDSRATKDDLP